ncbi:MAG: cobalamin B12-binding domain-containing protein [Acidobacteria bacterium]|nr:cobalamin B12-binding domain-containing protein [Acidobacteriota bacterium]
MHFQVSHSFSRLFAPRCPPGQLHELGALLAGAAAANLGWHVTYLGPSLPAAEIVGAARQNHARAVALSLVYPEDDPRLAVELAALRQSLPPEIALLAGVERGQSWLLDTSFRFQTVGHRMPAAHRQPLPDPRRRHHRLQPQASRDHHFLPIRFLSPPQLRLRPLPFLQFFPHNRLRLLLRTLPNLGSFMMHSRLSRHPLQEPLLQLRRPVIPSSPHRAPFFWLLLSPPLRSGPQNSDHQLS